MDITPRISEAAQHIDGYDAAGFTVHGVRYAGPVLVLPHQVFAWDIPGGALAAEWFHPFATLPEPIDLLFIGTGARFSPLPSVIRSMLASYGIAAEGMDSAAACRSYNVLLAEGRRVGAALLPVGGA